MLEGTVYYGQDTFCGTMATIMPSGCLSPSIVFSFHPHQMGLSPLSKWHLRSTCNRLRSSILHSCWRMQRVWWAARGTSLRSLMLQQQTTSRLCACLVSALRVASSCSTARAPTTRRPSRHSTRYSLESFLLSTNAYMLQFLPMIGYLVLCACSSDLGGMRNDKRSALPTASSQLLILVTSV